MTAQRLPIPGQDDGTWGDILNDYLSVTHNPDGTLMPSAVTAAGAGTYSKPINGIPSTDLDAATQSKLAQATSSYVKPPNGIPASDLDAGTQSGLSKANTALQPTNTVAGDLTGTLAAPSIAKLQGTTLNSSSPSNGQVLTYSSTATAWVPGTVSSTTVNDATTSSKGIIQLAGDLNGTATNPTLTATNNVNSIIAANTTVSAKLDSTAAANIYAPKASPTFTGSVTVPMPTNGTDAATKSYVDAAGTGSPDATTTTKGKVQLAGDLAGTAAAPTVSKLNGIAVPAVTPITGQVLTATSATATSWLSPSSGGAQALSATSVKTAAYTAVPGDLIPVDVSGGTFTITLPASPVDKTRIVIKKIDNSVNVVTIAAANGDVFNKVSGVASLTLTVPNQSINLQYAATASIWYVVGDDLPLSQLDSRYAKTNSIFTSVKDYGAKGDSVTDDTVAITAAINAVNAASGGIVYFPSGTYVTGQLTIYSNMIFMGTGPGGSIIQLKAGSNTDLVITNQFATLTGGNGNGPSKFGFQGLTLDANKANQTSTSLCARIYGYNYTVVNTWFNNGFGGGVYSEWGGTDNPMEAMWENFKIYNYGGQPGCTGLEWNGPHDSLFSNGVIATLDSVIKSTDVGYGATPINGGTATLPASGTTFTFSTSASASSAIYPVSGGTFVVPIASGAYSWATITYTSASTSGGSTTFSGCTSPQGGINVTASGGIVVPTYGYRGRSTVEGAGHTALGEMMTTVHVWGRNHIGIYTDTSMYFTNCESEGAFIANVVLDASGSVWTGGTIYGTNGQSGQANETGLQIGQNYNTSRCVVIAFIYNVGAGSGGASIRMTRTTGNNMLRVAGTTGANAFLNSPFYNASGDWYEIVCHNTPALSVYHVPYQPKFPIGTFIGNGTNLPTSGGHLYAGSGVPSITNAIAGDYYFRTDTPTTASQQIYVATGANTWAAISSGGSSGSSTLAGDTDVAISGPINNQILTYNSTTSKWTNTSANSLTTGGVNVPIQYSTALGANATYTSDPVFALDPNIFGSSPFGKFHVQIRCTQSLTATLSCSPTGAAGSFTTIASLTPSSYAGSMMATADGPIPQDMPYLQLAITNGNTAQGSPFGVHLEVIAAPTTT